MIRVIDVHKSIKNIHVSEEESINIHMSWGGIGSLVLFFALYEILALYENSISAVVNR